LIGWLAAISEKYVALLLT